MKKFNRPLFILLFAVLLSFAQCKMYYPLQAVSFQVPSSGANVERGRHITMMACGTCHYNPETKQLTGIRMADAPKFVGRLVSRNITKDPEFGIGKYTDGELAYLIRTGISRTGKNMPFMERPNLADEDLANIIAFLHSNDPLVQASKISAGNTKYSWVGKAGLSLVGKPLPYPDRPVSLPDQSDKHQYGKYLVENLGCYDCHRGSLTGTDAVNIENSRRFCAGGTAYNDRNGKKVHAANITPHETGLKNWTEDDFRRAIKEGVNKDNKILRFPMPVYGEMYDDEVSAIYTYLQSIPPLDNKVKR